jgi:hypothetical protein
MEQENKQKEYHQKGGNKKYILNARQTDIHNKLTRAFLNTMHSEGILVSDLSIVSGVSKASLYGFLNRNRPMTTYNLMKLCECLGFEIALVKKFDSLNYKNDAAMMQKLMDYKQKYNMYENKRQSAKQGREIGANTDSGYLSRFSQRKRIESEQAEDDIFGAL